MALFCELLGGSQKSALGLAGMGDLEVTAFSGRNRLYGLAIGRGEPPLEAARRMTVEGLTVEGLPALVFAAELARTHAGERWHESFPLLSALSRMVSGEPVGTEELFLAAQGWW
jgi:glycerol-3-phosphate dehydrogenase (NAD(P)+)